MTSIKERGYCFRMISDNMSTPTVFSFDTGLSLYTVNSGNLFLIISDNLDWHLFKACIKAYTYIVFYGNKKKVSFNGTWKKINGFECWQKKKIMLPFVSEKKFQCQEKKPRPPPGYQMVGPLLKKDHINCAWQGESEIWSLSHKYNCKSNAPLICNHSPTYVEGLGLWLFSFQCLAISPTPRRQTLLSAPPFITENLPWVRILMSKPCHFPYTVGKLEK